MGTRWTGPSGLVFTQPRGPVLPQHMGSKHLRGWLLIRGTVAATGPCGRCLTVGCKWIGVVLGPLSCVPPLLLQAHVDAGLTAIHSFQGQLGLEQLLLHHVWPIRVSFMNDPACGGLQKLRCGLHVGWMWAPSGWQLLDK